jgi:hypothetical protein
MPQPTNDTLVSYEHIQSAPLCILVYAMAILFLVLGLTVRDAPPVQWLFPPIGLMMLTIAASFHHLSVKDEGEQLAIRFGPLPLFRKSISYDNISKVEAGRTMWLDGFGIHKSIRGGWVWNLWGRDCVVVHFQDQSTLRIGTDDQVNLLTFLNAKLVQ